MSEKEPDEELISFGGDGWFIVGQIEPGEYRVTGTLTIEANEDWDQAMERWVKTGQLVRLN